MNRVEATIGIINNIMIFISLFIVTAYKPCGYAQRSGEIIYQISTKSSGIGCDFHKNSLVMDAMGLWSFGRLVGIWNALDMVA